MIYTETENKPSVLLNMKKAVIRVLMMTAVLLLSAVPVSAEQTSSEDKAMWTVMIYFCGSDLESLHGMATYNLKEMTEIHPVVPVEELLNSTYDLDMAVPSVFNDVNVVFETGGSEEWHAKEEVGIDISTETLQRWQFTPVGETEERSPFTLLEEVPLSSMAEPETLSDFIRWSAETCPAEKYALVLWDHGGGSATGIFVDELFGNDIMYLDELDQALAGGGVHFETVILDACMMACLETAQALAPYASYMVASEEVTSGYGSAFQYWMNELFVNPYRDGKQFGICVCDMTVRKYAELEIDEAYDLLTYSVVDLSYIGELSAIFNNIFAELNDFYLNYPDILSNLERILGGAETYGTGKARMLDIGSILYNNEVAGLIYLDHRMVCQNILNNAVTYCVRGKSRSEASGLSFCYAVNLEPKDLDIYARNCRTPYYLAYLDAVTEWEAPPELYETVSELPEFSENEAYRLDTEIIEYNGIPSIAVMLDQANALGGMQYYEFYRFNEENDQYMLLGKDECRMGYDEDTFKLIFYGDEPETWPSIENELCCIDIVTSTEDEIYYNIPIRMDRDIFNFRCSYSKPSGEKRRPEEEKYMVHGIWNGYDADTGIPNRNVSRMSDYQGWDYRLLYPVYAENEDADTFYLEGDDQTMYRSILIESITVPPGEYAVRYILTDIHGREIPQKMVHLHWDGEVFTMQE